MELRAVVAPHHLEFVVYLRRAVTAALSLRTQLTSPRPPGSSARPASWPSARSEIWREKYFYFLFRPLRMFVSWGWTSRPSCWTTPWRPPPSQWAPPRRLPGRPTVWGPATPTSSLWRPLGGNVSPLSQVLSWYFSPFLYCSSSCNMWHKYRSPQ